MMFFLKSRSILPGLAFMLLFPTFQVRAQIALNLKSAMQYAVDNNSKVIQGKLMKQGV